MKAIMRRRNQNLNMNASYTISNKQFAVHSFCILFTLKLYLGQIFDASGENKM